MAVSEDIGHVPQTEDWQLGLAAALEEVHSALLAKQVRPNSVLVGTATTVPGHSLAMVAQSTLVQSA